MIKKEYLIHEAAFFGEAIVLAAATTTRHGNNENPYLYKLDPVSHEVTLWAPYEHRRGLGRLRLPLWRRYGFAADVFV